MYSYLCFYHQRSCSSLLPKTPSDPVVSFLFLLLYHAVISTLPALTVSRFVFFYTNPAMTIIQHSIYATCSPSISLSVVLFEPTICLFFTSVKQIKAWGRTGVKEQLSKTPPKTAIIKKKVFPDESIGTRKCFGTKWK